MARMVKFDMPVGSIFINPDNVTYIATPVDKAGSIVIGRAMIFVLGNEQAIVVDHSPTEAAMKLSSDSNGADRITPFLMDPH